MTLDHSQNTFKAMSRAMEELVLPALDPSDQLVYEQAALVTKFLAHLGSRAPYLVDRMRSELTWTVTLTEALTEDAVQVDQEISTALRARLTEASTVLRDPEATLERIDAAVARLTATTSALVRRVGETDVPAELRERVESTVVRCSLPSIEAQRAWFLDQGWEPDPAAVPSLDRAFRP